MGARRLDAFGWACLVAAPPIAWAAAATGHGYATPLSWPVLGGIVLASVAEEIVFRGGLQQALLRWPPAARRAFGVSIANVLVSLLFAAAHLWRHPPLAALGVLPVSLVLGLAFERQGQRLAVPIGLHLYFNAALYGASLLVR